MLSGFELYPRWVPLLSLLIFPEYLPQTLQGSQEPEAGRRKEVSDSFYHTLG